MRLVLMMLGLDVLVWYAATMSRRRKQKNLEILREFGGTKELPFARQRRLDEEKRYLWGYLAGVAVQLFFLVKGQLGAEAILLPMLTWLLVWRGLMLHYRFTSPFGGIAIDDYPLTSGKPTVPLQPSGEKGTASFENANDVPGMVIDQDALRGRK